jgi:uncharacterized protein with HEPN domain
MPFADPRARPRAHPPGHPGDRRLRLRQDAPGLSRSGWLRLATQRGIEIVSEASRHIPDHLKPRYPGIPWRDIAGIGNLLRHGYDTLDHAVIWGVVEAHLPSLKAAVEAMLREIEGGRRMSISACAARHRKPPF